MKIRLELGQDTKTSYQPYYFRAKTESGMTFAGDYYATHKEAADAAAALVIKEDAQVIELIKKGTYRDHYTKTIHQWEITKEGEQRYFEVKGLERHAITAEQAETLLNKALTD